jgi:heme A synthase
VSGAGSVAFAVALAAFIAWRLYRRTRKLIGRQRSTKGRHVASVILLPLLLAMLAMGAFFAGAAALLALAGGVAIGAALAIWGLKLTRFERTEEGWFYTPNARIGIALMALLVGRLAWRLVELARVYGTPLRGASQDVMRSPLTLLIVATMLAYYAAYAAGLLRWRLASE